MVGGLAADDDEVLVRAELTPDRCGRVLRQAAEVDELALGRDLGESSAISLGDDGELAAVRTGPAPSRGALAGTTAQVGMGLEVVEIDLENAGTLSVHETLVGKLREVEYVRCCT